MAGMIAPILALALQTSADMNRGSALYAQCKIFVTMADTSQMNGTTPMLDAGTCLGYLSGFADAGTVAGSFCVKGTTGTLARVYIAYMDKHPTLFDSDREVGVGLALKDAYPCPVK